MREFRRAVLAIGISALTFAASCENSRFSAPDHVPPRARPDNGIQKPELLKPRATPQAQSERPLLARINSI